MSNSDPIWQAIVEENEQCPDGRALVELGKQVRTHTAPERTANLRASILAACKADDDALPADDHGESHDDDELIDAWFNDGDQAAAAADPSLQRLSDLVRDGSQPEREADLLPLIHKRIAQNNRSSRRISTVAVDGSTRWRIWTGVVAGHAAALLALAALHVTVGRQSQLPQQLGHSEPTGLRHHRINIARMNAGAESARPLALQLPVSWSELKQRNAADLLFVLRTSERRRADAREAFNASASEQTVAAGLRWLVAQADAQTGTLGSTAGPSNAVIATQSLAALALLGEGLADRARLGVVERLVPWIRQRVQQAFDADEPIDQRSLGLATLVVVEGALLIDNDQLKRDAESLLAAVNRRLVKRPGEGGLGGFGLLAVETAYLGRLSLPGGLRGRVEHALARQLPPNLADAGRLGLAAFARQLKGFGHNDSTRSQLQRISQRLPVVDADGRSDVMSWFFPTLAMREQRGHAWLNWNDALQAALLRGFDYNKDGTAYVPAERVRYAGGVGEAGDVLATAATVLALQVPYRYLPLRM